MTIGTEEKIELEDEPRSVAVRASIEAKYRSVLEENLKLGRLVSYVGNKPLPILRLYRYKEAFSLGLVNYFLDRFEADRGDVVFDPFAGMGTTLFGSMLRGLPSVGVEKLPVGAFVAETFPKFLAIEPGTIAATFEGLLRSIEGFSPASVADDVRIMSIAYKEPELMRLRKWKTAISTLSSPMREVFTLLFLSILESVSYTANDGQFLRFKPDKKPLISDDALAKKVCLAETDLIAAQHTWTDKTRYRDYTPTIHRADSRCLGEVQFGRKPTILITSPPYPNRYDYTRSYCLELCIQFVRDFQELKSLRFGILRSHIESKAEKTEQPCHPAISEVLENLGNKTLNNPRIPTMLTSYFIDMEKCIRQWSHILSPNARVALVVDNVRFEGQLVPVDLILCDLAERHGFRVDKVMVARYKGNSSQQMGRYGRVAVRESVVLWSKA